MKTTLAEAMDDFDSMQSYDNFEECEINLNSSIIGTLSKPIKNFTIDNTSKVDIKDKLSLGSFETSTVMDNGDFVVICLLNNSYTLALFDNKYNLIRIHEMSSIFDNQLLKTVHFIAKFDGKLVLSCYDGTNEIYKLTVLCRKFKIESLVEPDIFYNSMCSNSTNIMCLSDEEKSIHIYDSNLDFLIEIKSQADSILLPFYFGTETIEQIEILQNKYILRSTTKIFIINSETGN
jgi:hypothetical protein